MFASFDPIIYLHLPIVLAIVAVVYSATRYDDWGLILWESLRWFRNMILFLLGIGGALIVVSFFA